MKRTREMRERKEGGMKKRTEGATAFIEAEEVDVIEYQ